MKNALLLSLVLVAAASCLEAQEFKPLAGQYAIASKSLVDPPPDEKKDRLLLWIQGSGAKDIFESMAGPARKDACNPDLVKRSAGALKCAKHADGDYLCTIGVLLTTGSTVKGSVC